MFWNKPKWNKVPGCFERHLQRRDGNILFPLERRSVTEEDIKQARIKDKKDQDIFIDAVNKIIKSTINRSIQQQSSLLQKVQSLLEEGAAIGGNITSAVRALEDTEKEIVQTLSASVPEGGDLLEQAKSLSTMRRIPYVAQILRSDTPILVDERIPTLLSEDQLTISLVGFVSRSFPDFRPSSADINMFIDKAVLQSFDKRTAEQILTSWNEMK